MRQRKTPAGGNRTGAGKVVHIQKNKPALEEIQAASHFNPAFMRAVDSVHAQGPRATAELLLELANELQRPFTVAGVVHRYASLPPDILRHLGVDQIPYPQPHEVRS